MKGKYITKQLMLVCLSKPATIKKDIQGEIRATIAERNEIIKEMEKIVFKAEVIKMYLSNANTA